MTNNKSSEILDGCNFVKIDEKNKGRYVLFIKSRNSRGISLIALIITIIVIIILAAIVISMSISTPEKANYAKFVSELSQIEELVSLARNDNLIQDAVSQDPISKDAGFKKVTIRNAPGNFSSVDGGDAITGYIVNFDKINMNEPEGLTDTTELTEIDFSLHSAYIYDANGVVYKTTGYNENGEIHYTANEKSFPWDGKTQNTTWYDKNKSAHEFYINTANEWAGLAKIVNSTEGTYATEFFKDDTIYLNNDIDMGGRWIENEDGTVTGTGTNYTPIGTFTKPFEGTFNGQYHGVSGIYINEMKREQGLFGCSSGTIENVVTNGYLKAVMNVGGIVGYAKGGYVINCCNKASISGTRFFAGVVGYSNGDIVIENCFNLGNIVSGARNDCWRNNFQNGCRISGI